MNSPAILFCSVIAGALLLAACDKKAAPPVTESASAGTPAGTPMVSRSQAAMISASPNPVPAGSTPGTTTIKWNTGLSPTAEVYVSTNGEKEALFASGAEGSSDAPWIQAGMTYEFRLYAGSEHKNVLARVTVTRQK